tara:strand:- start:2149 stop:3120 length:972 start_codon:yes stop_codon:yes gene_type:complete
MKILITGCAGFIGYNLCRKLLIENKYKIYGIDNINDYYDVELKKSRIKDLKKNYKHFNFKKVNISNKNLISKLFIKEKFTHVINLAAQAGVRFSIENPLPYVESNLIGFFNILDASRKNKIKHLIFASTSSVYGDSKKFPLKETSNTDKPLSFYAATKKSNEVMAYSYSNIYGLPCTGLRFFTVYGPYGRPDMALFKFTKSIINNDTIELFNQGNHIRDFTYIDDVTTSIVKLIDKASTQKIPFEIFNIGNSKPEKLKLFLTLIEKTLGINAKVKLLKLQKGDVHKTHADTSKIVKKINYKPHTKISEGIKKFIDWYINFYKK